MGTRESPPDLFDVATLTESPALVELERKLDEGDGAALATFWQAMRARGTPLVEPLADSPDHLLVTFLYRSATAAHVVIPTPPELTRRRDDPRIVLRLGRLAGTDLWARSYRLPADARFPYSFAPDLPSSPPKDELNWQRIVRADPLNRHRVGLRQSLCELPNAPDHPLLRPSRDVPAGVVRVHRVTSRRLGNSRRIYVYTPPGYDDAAGPYPLLVLFDGSDYLAATPTPTILDHLIAEGRVPPTIALMIDPVDRIGEFSLDEPFTDVVAREIVPFVQQRYRATTDPSAVVVGGISGGGVGAVWAAFRHPDVFGNVLAQSDARYRLASGEDVYQHIARKFSEAPRQPIRLLVEDGRIDDPAVLPFAHLRPVLQAKGYPLICRRYTGGHHMTSTRVRLADALVELLHDVRPQHETARSPTDDLQIEDLGESLLAAVMKAAALDGAGEALRVFRASLGASADADESMLDVLGFELLYTMQEPAAAIAVFEERLRRFPASAKALDSLGEACLVAGERERAIESYEKALAIDARNENARILLEELRREAD